MVQLLICESSMGVRAPAGLSAAAGGLSGHVWALTRPRTRAWLLMLPWEALHRSVAH